MNSDGLRVFDSFLRQFVRFCLALPYQPCHFGHFSNDPGACLLSGRFPYTWQMIFPSSNPWDPWLLYVALLYLRYTREVSDPAHRQEYLDYLAQIEALRGGCQRCSSATTLIIYWWCLRPLRIEFRVPDEFVRKCQAGWGCSTEPRQAKGEMPEGQQLLRCQPGLCVTRCTNLSTFVGDPDVK